MILWFYPLSPFLKTNINANKLGLSLIKIHPLVLSTEAGAQNLTEWIKIKDFGMLADIQIAAIS